MNRFYRCLFNQVSDEVWEKVLIQVNDLEQSAILGLTEEETDLLRKRLGIYGQENSMYKNMIEDDLTVSKLMTKLSHIETKVEPALEEFTIKENLATHQIQQLSEYSMEELSAILGKREALKVRDYAHKNEILLQGEVKEDILPISILELEPRYTNGLMRAGIKTVSNLLTLTSADIGSIRGFGEKSKENIKRAVEAAGYHLATTDLPKEKNTSKLTK